MYTFDQQLPVRLQFRAMAEPIAVSVPGHVLIYLDTHAQRTFGPDGNVIYQQPEPQTSESRRSLLPA